MLQITIWWFLVVYNTMNKIQMFLCNWPELICITTIIVYTYGYILYLLLMQKCCISLRWQLFWKSTDYSLTWVVYFFSVPLVMYSLVVEDLFFTGLCIPSVPTGCVFPGGENLLALYLLVIHVFAGDTIGCVFPDGKSSSIHWLCIPQWHNWLCIPWWWELLLHYFGFWAPTDRKLQYLAGGMRLQMSVHRGVYIYIYIYVNPHIFTYIYTYI